MLHHLHTGVGQDKNVQESCHDHEGQRAAYLNNSGSFMYDMSKGSITTFLLSQTPAVYLVM